MCQDAEVQTGPTLEKLQRVKEQEQGQALGGEERPGEIQNSLLLLSGIRESQLEVLAIQKEKPSVFEQLCWR